MSNPEMFFRRPPETFDAQFFDYVDKFKYLQQFKATIETKVGKPELICAGFNLDRFLNADDIKEISELILLKLDTKRDYFYRKIGGYYGSF